MQAEPASKTEEAPTPADVVVRAQCVTALLVRAQIEEQLLAAPTTARAWAGALDRLEGWMKGEGLDAALVPEERALLEGRPWGDWTREEASAAAWRIEGLAVLYWALGRFDLDEPGITPVDAEQVQATTSLLPLARELVRGAALRPHAERDRLRRTTGVWRWRARTELLHRRGKGGSGGAAYADLVARAADRAAAAGLMPVGEADFLVGQKPFGDVSETELRTFASVALERGRAADWLCGKAAWDASAEL